MLKTNVSTTITGQSIITDSTGNDRQVAYLNATINESKNININKSIQDMELFTVNKTEVLADFTEFENYVYSLCAE